MSPSTPMGLRLIYVFVLVLQSVDQYPALAVQFRIQPIPGRVICDITLRMVLLKSGDSPFLIQAPLSPTFPLLFCTTGWGPLVYFHQKLKIDLNTGVGADDFDSTVVVAPNPPETFPTGHRRITADRVALSVTDAPNGWPMDVAGGIVEGDMVSLAGVGTDYNSLLNSGYVEHPVNIRGIALGRLEDGASPTSPLPKTATWLEIQATPTSAVPPGKSRQIFVDLRTPTRGDAPKTARPLRRTQVAWSRIGSYPLFNYLRPQEQERERIITQDCSDQDRCREAVGAHHRPANRSAHTSSRYNQS